MTVIKITTVHEIDLDNLLGQFEKSWNIKFDGTKKTKCMLFEELTFGQHMSPSTAQQIVEAVASYVNTRKTVLRMNPKN